MNKENLAYIIGVAMGDGNLSNPNGRAVRLRVTCDTKYPLLIKKILREIQKLLPKNKVSIVKRKDSPNCVDISCYSNKWEGVLGWKVNAGSKFKQKISVPIWVKGNKKYTAFCLKGLFETDGSVYYDRKYLMVNFVTIIPTLATDVMKMIEKLGFKPNIQAHAGKTKKIKYTIRVSRDVDRFVNLVGINKS